MVKLSVFLPDGIHRLLKVKAAQNGTSLQALAEKAITLSLDAKTDLETAAPPPLTRAEKCRFKSAVGKALLADPLIVRALTALVEKL